MMLPPTLLNGYLVRTWFGDDDAWRTVVEILKTTTSNGYPAGLEPVSDPQFASASPEQVLACVVRQPSMAILTIADEVTLTTPQWPVLVLSLIEPENYKPFRCTAASLPEVEGNLTGANISWSEFEAETDADGIFRGFA